MNNGQTRRLTAPPDVSNLVDVELIGSRHFKKYRLQFNTYQVTVQNLDTMTFAEILLSISEHVLKVTLRDVANHERVRLRIDSSQLKIPIWTSLTRRNQLTVG